MEDGHGDFSCGVSFPAAVFTFTQNPCLVRFDLNIDLLSKLCWLASGRLVRIVRQTLVMILKPHENMQRPPYPSPSMMSSLSFHVT